MRIEINHKAIKQYFLIYWIIQLLGTNLFYVLGTDLVFAINIGICVIFLASGVRLSKYAGYSILIVVFFSLITNTITGGTLTVGTVLNLLGKISIGSIAVEYDKSTFVQRFLRLVAILSGISLFLWIGYMFLGESFVSPLKWFLYHNGKANTYGLFFIGFNFGETGINSGRNTYIFGEPGKYQILLISALYMLFFFEQELRLGTKKKLKYYLLFFLTLLSVQSTEGYVNAIILFCCILLTRNSEEHGKIRKLVLISIIVMLLYFCFFAGSDSFIYTQFLNKILDDSGRIDLYQGTAGARTQTIESYSDFLRHYPWYALFGAGSQNMTVFYEIGGLLGMLYYFGILCTVAVYGVFIYMCGKYKSNYVELIAAIFLIVNHGISQPDFFNILTYILILCWRCHSSLYLSENLYLNVGGKQC